MTYSPESLYNAIIKNNLSLSFSNKTVLCEFMDQKTETVLMVFSYNNSDYIIGLFKRLNKLLYVKYFEEFQVYNKHYVNVGHYYLQVLKIICK